MSETDSSDMIKTVSKFVIFFVLSIIVIILSIISNEFIFELDTEIFAILLVFVGFTIILLVTWKVVND